MERQLQVLNQDFSRANISFTLRNTTWTENEDWASGANGVYSAMVATLHQGGNDALNLYFVEVVSPYGFPPPYDDENNELLGIASYPWDASTTDHTSSVCVVAAGTVPGGDRAPTNLGKTATHEVGHWFGLYHPFEGGCVADPNGGDRVSDTPAAANATFGCESSRDSCPDLPGLDPLQNFMGAADE
ncbi:metalloprotease MEP1 [Cordyceps fumosorosea ARSEF 2679]|uniref:Metalloprotease MEP1 n=1 Tax=Cordyceps fumosorosea (strain ARSEF 2679) TaxID=1081104 RepID=A0A167LPI7_CORFA|nr:metalloprotease MEP1 [Cordyceps fumosorosea ARSEF 2679]OAA53337.1 metalloprotease MEP1 [Cordyceps fumosorosea ARSEF 2679]